MENNFQAALTALGGADAVVRIARETRPPSDYLFTTLLPDRLKPSYRADDGAMVVRATMAGAVGMDSKYPEGGLIDVTTFAENIAKLAIQVNLSEKSRRDLREFAERAILNGGSAGPVFERALLNFVDKLLLQGLWDRAEYLRGRALATGAIAWTFNGINLAIDYQIPLANKFATRTGTAAYGGSASVFWADVKAGRRLLRGSLRVAIAHSDTIDAIIYNSANAANIVSDEGGSVRIQRYRGTLERPSTDAQESMALVRYDKEGEVFDPTIAGATIKVPFMPRGVVLLVGDNPGTGEFIVGEGEGSTDNPANTLELGYTHVGPTEEANGTPGRWARVYTPDDMPMQFRGQAASNELPVIRATKKIVLLSTDLT